MSRRFAIDALLASEGELPCRVKFAIEGEEETSSVHLHDFVELRSLLSKGSGPSSNNPGQHRDHRSRHHQGDPGT